MRDFLQGQGRRPALAGLTARIHLSILSPARRDEPDAEIAENSHSRTAS